MKARLRMVNLVLTVAIICCFVLHGLHGAFAMAGVDTTISSDLLSHALVTLIVAHAAIGCYLGADTLRACRRSGAPYLRANARFWAARISGLAIIVFVALHLVQFMWLGDGPFRLQEFGAVQLAESLCLVLSLALHLFLNVKPLAISLGLGRPGARALDIALALSTVMLIMAACFVVYYLSWSVI